MITLNTKLSRLTFAMVFFILAACNDSAESSSEDTNDENHTVQWGVSNPGYLKSDVIARDAIDTNGVGVAGSQNGEVVILNGKALATNSDGEVTELDENDSLAVSVVTSNFTADIVNTTTENLNCETDLNDYLNELVGDSETERIATVIITGYFPFISYVTDSAVSESTPINTVEHIQATIVGFKSPYYFGDDSWEENGISVGIGESPYHYHFVSDDETVLGHIRDCDIDTGSTIELGLVNIYNLRMDYSEN